MAKNPRIILIYGAPYVGKSTISVALAKRLNIRQVVDLDVVREVLRGERSKKEDPFLFLSACTAWKYNYEKTERNIINSYIQYCKTIEKSIKRIIEMAYSLGKDTIIEGVHILPSSFYPYLQKKNFHMILVLCEKTRHLKNISQRKIEYNNHSIKQYYDRLPVAFSINDYLKDQAKKYNLIYVINNFLKSTENKIMKIMKNENN